MVNSRKKTFPSNTANKLGHPQSSECTRKIPTGANWPYEYYGTLWVQRDCMSTKWWYEYKGKLGFREASWSLIFTDFLKSTLNIIEKLN